MKPRERLLAAFRFEQPDDMVPAWEVEFQLYQELLGRFPTVGYEYARLSRKEKERATYSNAELMIEAAERTEQCALFCFPSYWEAGPGDPALLWLPEEDDRLAHIRALRELGGHCYLILGHGGAVPGIPTGEQMAEYCYYLYDHLDEATEQAARTMRESIASGRRELEAGADGVVMCSDVAFNNGPFLPPLLIDRLITPNVRLWAETFRELGAVTIWHSDGDMTALMPMIADAGVTALQAVDPIAGMDIVALKREYYGRLTLIGNVNCLTLQFGPPEAIEEECRHILEGCKAGGGYVFGSSNAVFKGIPVEHYQVAIDALRKYGRY
ncbi:MAG: uroporphyrinogen decarboxylase family protein [Anaerolineae bacterium]|nr:uroporphyrinogen decarboxylase family protein [Anaerolineae bacterium]